LGDLVAYLEAAGAATPPNWPLPGPGLPGENAHPAYLGDRLCAVRGFARHVQAFDPTTEVPPTGLLPFAECRAVPYLYADDEVKTLMEAARSLTPALRAATWASMRIVEPRHPPRPMLLRPSVPSAVFALGPQLAGVPL
jgi:integrase/recombinase XerD